MVIIRLISIIRNYTIFCNIYFFKKHFKLESFIVSIFQNDNKIEEIKKELNIVTKEQEKEMNEIYEGIVEKLIHEKIKEIALKKYPNVLPESSEICIIIQVISLISSLGLLIYFMIKILF